MKKKRKFNRGLFLLIVSLTVIIIFFITHYVNRSFADDKFTSYAQEFLSDYSRLCVIPNDIREEFKYNPEVTYEKYEVYIKDVLSGYFDSELLLDSISKDILTQFETEKYYDLLYVSKEEHFEMSILKYEKGVYYCSLSYTHIYASEGKYDSIPTNDVIELKKIDGKWYIHNYIFGTLNIYEEG